MMRIFWTFFWAFLLGQMFTYVISSMLGVAFDFKMGVIIAVIMALFAFLISALMPNEPAEKH